jgi:hypothetical protein
MDIPFMSSREIPGVVRPVTPPKQCVFKIVCSFLGCRLLANLTRSTLDAPRKRYIKELKVYQQCMDDQEKQERGEQQVSFSTPASPPVCARFSSEIQTFTKRLRVGVKDFYNVRQRHRRRRHAIKEGSPPPRRPPCCPHWDDARPRKCEAQTKRGTERLRVYEPGQRSRLERYEERLRDPTSKEARRKAACETLWRDCPGGYGTSRGGMR